MTTALDMPTLVLSTGVAATCAMLSMLFVWRVHAREPAVPYWTLAFLLLALGAGVAVLRAELPPLLGIVASNALVLSGGFVMRTGTALFCRRRHANWRLPTAVVVTAVAAMAWWTAVTPDYRLRVAAFSVALSVALYQIVRDLDRYSRGPSPLISRVLSLVFAAALVMTVVRGLVIQFDDAAEGLFRFSWTQTLWFASAIAVIFFSPFGFLLLTSQRLQMRLDRLANEDDLTGVLNRRAFLARTLEHLAELPPAQPTTLLVLDLDHFKQFNDSHGHAAGDAVLRSFARNVAAQLRPTDLFARVGGEEFWILAADTDVLGARELGERLRATVETMEVTFGEKSLATTVSIGISPVSQGDVSQALSAADRALYQAKHQGRNRVVVA